MSIFVIMNEWTAVDGQTGAEIVGANWFPTEDDAHEALSLIAESFGCELGADETSFALENNIPSFQYDYDEYYIQELIRK